ncbi:Subtilase [Parasponia andersonii]|uniref:Subtilase n=1 Tax=Parasponia andersonii TaxID=3476 RepID=A0A2P5BEM2_PARAD|nr:Subtilase [Parasponia andersonii]
MVSFLLNQFGRGQDMVKIQLLATWTLSFSDEGIGPVPSKWQGICQDGVRCNSISEYSQLYFSPVRNSTLFSTRDHEGHGTHTLSTAGGNFVTGANVFGNGNGTAKGGSPKARVAAYKVCWQPVDDHSCFDADIMAAFEAAITDGVDVLSVSVGGDSQEYFPDGISIGGFHAVKNGIAVVTSAGNSGPHPGTIENGAPWMITVGASTIDREVISYIALGNRKRLKGASLSSRGLQSQKYYPLIRASEAKADTTKVSALDALLCKPGSLDPKTVKGKILVCLRGEIARAEKGLEAALAGAVGMILANDMENWNDITADAHVLPASHVNFTDGKSFTLTRDTFHEFGTPVAYMTRAKTEVDVKPAPFMAAFSSRGPNIIEPAILKPDLTAPGVNIITACSEANGPTDEKFDKRRVTFNAQSRTSMACLLDLKRFSPRKIELKIIKKIFKNN